LLLLLAAGPARAGDPEEARRHFDRAQTAYKLGRFDEAIREYEAAYREMPEPAFLFNLAQAHRQQYQIDREPSHLQKSLSLYRAYLREAPAAPNRETVTRLIEELKGLLSDIENRSSASKEPGVLVLHGGSARGAQVRVDGKVVGQIPLSTKLPAGSYFVQVSLPGHSPWSSALTIAPGSRLELPVVLEPLPSSSASTPPPRAKPFYKRWWFWTIIGAAVSAGTGVGIYLGTRESVTPMPELDLR
jgi:tetratricopeptide (TPR) repeat protein